MLECDRRQGKRTFQDMTLLWVLLLTATLAGHVYSDDYDYTAGGDAYGDPEEAEGSDYIAPTEDTALTTVSQPGDEVGMTTEDTGWSGGGEDTLARFNSPTFSEGGGSGIYPSEEPMGESELSPLAIIIPLALLLLLAGAVTAFAISRRKAKKHSGGSGDMREDDIFSGCDTEKVPMPMFEDDVPSVLELEMEDLEKWMVKDSGGICLDSEKND